MSDPYMTPKSPPDEMKRSSPLFLLHLQLIVTSRLHSAIGTISLDMTLLLFLITLFLQFHGLNCTPDPDSNGIYLAEKVLAIERMMLTPGTIDFQVAPCDFLLNGPPALGPDAAGDQVR